MTPRQKLLRVELPLAAPVVMAGIRTAAVWTIGMATLSTTVGQTSLGNFIFSGLQTENWISVLTGCAAVVALALIADLALGLIEAAATGRDVVRMAAGLAILILDTAAAATPLIGSRSGGYVVGAKNFSEQFILAELMATRLEAAGHKVERKQGLGSAVIFRALAGGDIDAYVDYSGTLWTNVLGRTDTPARDAMLAELTAILRERYGVSVLGALGFENAYALAMRRCAVCWRRSSALSRWSACGRPITCWIATPARRRSGKRRGFSPVPPLGRGNRICRPLRLFPRHIKMAGTSPAIPIPIRFNPRTLCGGDPHGSPPERASRVTGPRSSRTTHCRRWRRGPAGCNPATCATKSGNAGRPCRRCLPGRHGPAWRCRTCCSTSCCRSG